MMTVKLLDFSDGKPIVGKLVSPKAVLHYTWLQTQTIPNYNEISEKNTEIPSWEDFWLNVVHAEMLDKDCPKSHGAWFRIAYSMAKIMYKTEFERLEIKVKDNKAKTHDKAKAKAKEVKAKAKVEPKESGSLLEQLVIQNAENIAGLEAKIEQLVDLATK